MKRQFLVYAILACGSIVCAQPPTSSEPAPPGNPVQQASPAAPSAGETASQVAHLHVYRHRKYVGSALAPSIYVDDKQVARVGNGRRCTIRLSPGSHAIRSDDKSSAVNLDAKAGQDYFVRIDEEAGFWKGHGKLTMLMPEQGSAEYKLQKPIEEERVMAKDMLEEDASGSSPKK